MNTENKLARLSRNTGPARFFIPVGIILIVFGIILSGMRTDKFEQTVGTVTSVTEEIEDGQKQYDVGVAYTVDGKQYETTFENLTGDFTEGAQIDVYYNPENPESTSNARMSSLFSLALIGLGALAVVFGILQTVKAFKKSRELDEAAPAVSDSARAALDSIKTAPGVTEYYFRFDGNSLKPGYLIEDAARQVLFEGKMLKNSMVGPRTFEFSDHTTGSVKEHEVGHTTTASYSNEFFSVRSWFKVDGQNIWDLLHERGIRMQTDLRTQFPRIAYDVTRNGAAFARIESTSVHVHEEDEAQHKLAIPVGKMYYRFWTGSRDFESLFLTMFAVSETEQAFVE